MNQPNIDAVAVLRDQFEQAAKAKTPYCDMSRTQSGCYRDDNLQEAWKIVRELCGTDRAATVAKDGGAPVAYVIYSIDGRGQHASFNAKLTRHNPDWKTDDGGLGERWSGNEPVYLATPKPEASAATQQAGEVSGFDPRSGGNTAAARKAAERIDAMHKGVVGVFAAIKAEHDQSSVDAAAEVQAADIASYSEADQAFFAFWYAHRKDDVMTGALDDVSHATARYIWDSALAAPISEDTGYDQMLKAHELLSKHCVAFIRNGEAMSLLERIDELYSWYATIVNDTDTTAAPSSSYGKLPPLPTPINDTAPRSDPDRFSADQMRAYGRACLAARTPASVGEYSTTDYRNAPSGFGPLAKAWENKPHRLLYDLCTYIDTRASQMEAAPRNAGVDRLSQRENQLVKERDGWKEEAEARRRDATDARAKLDLQALHQRADVWYWQGDGTDYPESMSNSMAVVIRADQLKAMIHSAAPDTRDALTDEPTYWQWRRKDQPWELKNVFNFEVFATTPDSEVRILLAKSKGPAA